MVLQNATRKLYHRLATVFTIAAVVGVSALGSVANASDKTPTIDDIRAAWDKQNTASIAIRFVQDCTRQAGDAGKSAASGGKAESTLLEFTYIRTPEMLYLKDWTGREKSAERAGITRLGEGRSIEICGGEGMLKVNGQVVRIHSGDKTRIITPAAETERTWEMHNLETVFYRTYGRSDDPNTGFLYGWLKYAKLAEHTEEVDGHKCWRLDISNDGEGIVKRMQVWIDPAIAYCPRRICTEGMACGAVRGESGPVKIVTNFSEYAEISKGIWFPGKSVKVLNQANANAVNCTTVWTLKEVYKDRPCSQSDVMVKFNPGDTVYKIVPGEQAWDSDMKDYTVAADGSLVPVPVK